MKNKHILIAIAALAVTQVLIAVYFSRNTAKIAYVDSNLLLSKYQGMIDAQAVYKKKYAVWEAQIATLSKEFAAEESSFQTLKGDTKKKKLALILQKKEMELTKFKSGVAQKAKSENEKLTAAVYKTTNKIITKYAEKNNFDIVFGVASIGNVIYGGHKVNITDAVLEILNEDYSRSKQ